MEKEERQERLLESMFNGQRWYGVENEGTGKWFPKFDKCYIQGKSCVLYYRFGKLLEWNLLYSLN